MNNANEVYLVALGQHNLKMAPIRKTVDILYRLAMVVFVLLVAAVSAAVISLQGAV